MFHRYGKKAGTSASELPKDVTRMMTGDVLLSDSKRQQLLGQIREACILEGAQYDRHCQSLIDNLVRYCQQLPDPSNSFYSQPGGLLDYALNRTDAALNLFKHYLIKDEKAGYSELQALWQYALLSAALLLGIGKLQVSFEVTLFDAGGQGRAWNPVLESLSSSGSFYKWAFLKEADHALKCRLNLLLARSIMPEDGFAWIASNAEVLAVWLALLNEDPYSARTLGAILIQSDAIALQRYLNQLGGKRHAGHGRYGRTGTFAGDPSTDNEQQIGKEFILWLRGTLEAGGLVINKDALFMVPDGMLVTSDAFKLFAENNPGVSWQAARNAFLAMGLHKAGADGNTMVRYEQSKNQQMQTGVVFASFGVALPAKMQVHNMHTGRQIAMSGTDVIHMAQFSNYFTRQQHLKETNKLQGINAKGKWQPIPETEDLQSQPGITRGV